MKANPIADLKKLLIPILTLFAVSLAYPADLRDEARTLERSGNLAQAIDIYSQWLDENNNHLSATDVLLHASSLSESADDALELLLEYAPVLESAASAEIWARIANTEAVLGRLDDAATHFEAAGNAYLLDALILRFKMGEYEYVSRKALSLSGTAADEMLASDFFALYLYSLGMLDESGKAVNAAAYFVSENPESITPLLWFVYGEVARISGSTEHQGKARAGIQRMYPDSATGYLLVGRIKRWISPADLITTIEETGNAASVQTGAFRNRDSAAGLRHSLEEDGFTSWIEQVGELWRVYVNDPDGKVRDRLSDAGYDFSLGG